MLSSFLDWEVDFLQWLSEHRQPAVDFIIGLLNFSGEVIFFSIVLPLIYWLFSKRTGYQLAIVLFSSFYVNVLMKDLFHIARPYQAHGDRIIPLNEVGGSSFPSGHSQHSAATWGFLAAVIRRKWVYAVAGVLIGAVGFARMYSGVHYPKDVLVGWTVGLLIALAASIITQRLSAIRLSNTVLLIIAAAVPAVLLPLYHLTAKGVLDREGAYQACGLIAFCIVGHVWERSRIRFVIPPGWKAKLAAACLGLAGLMLIKEGVKLLLPEHPWSDFIRYGLMGLWTIAAAPWLFTALKLYPNERSEFIKETPSNKHIAG